MQRLEVSGAVRPLYESLGVKRLIYPSSNTQQTENKTTDVVIHQHSRRLLKMDILMSETC